MLLIVGPFPSPWNLLKTIMYFCYMVPMERKKAGKIELRKTELRKRIMQKIL